MVSMPPLVQLRVILFVLTAFFLANSTQAQTQTGVPVPVGTWTMVLSTDLPVQSNDWEQLIYISPIQRSVMLSQYHQNNSEPNESLVGYNFDANSWDVLDMGGNFHTESMPEGGESQGYFGFDPNNDTIEYHCCTSGSNQAENINHTWWFDVLGQSGRDKQTPVEPPPGALQPGGAFDVAHNVFVMYGGGSYVGTWIYDPVANAWQPKNATGTLPDPSVLLPGAAYDSASQHVFVYGGESSSGTTYYSDLYYYDVPTNTWSIISPVGGSKPPARCCMNFAYDSTNNIFLLYGGKNASGVLGDTWAYDPVANAWTQLTPSQSPAINTTSDFTRLAYDSDHNAFVLAHKGVSGYFGGNWSSLPIQTWLFRYAGPGPNAGTVLNNTQPSQGSLARNNTGWGKDPSVASSGNALYLGWAETSSPFDTSNAAWPHIYASQYSGGSWTPMGSTYYSISGQALEAHLPSMAIIGSTPWISWHQPVTRVFQIFAAYWNGSSWQGTGPIGLVGTSAVQGHSQLTGIAGTPYLGFIEVNKSVVPQTAYAYVKTWNGTSWSLVGTGALNQNTNAGSTATSISITSDGTSPYVAWTEYFRSPTPQGGLAATASQAYVSHWNGTRWLSVGGSLNVNGSSGWANDASIAFFNGEPYVAWTERTQTGNNQLYVATFNGSAWSLVGSGALNQGGGNGWAYHPSLVTDPSGSNLYIGWVEQTALGQKAQVYVSQLIAGTWTSLGGALNIDPVNGSAQRVSLAVYNGLPVATWGEINLGSVRQVYAAQWNGASWTQLSGTGGPLDTTPPTVPQGLTAFVASCTQVNLAWNGSTDKIGVRGYNIYRSGSNVGSATETRSYQDTGVSGSTTYTYKVAAYDAAGNKSTQSLGVTVTTPACGQ